MLNLLSFKKTPNLCHFHGHAKRLRKNKIETPANTEGNPVMAGGFHEQRVVAPFL